MRPWFSRRWIIQEVALADDSVPRTIICGDIALSRKQLASVAYRMASSGIIALVSGPSTCKP